MPGPAFGYGMLAVKGAATAHSTRGLWIGLLALDREGGMKWRVMVELGGVEGTVQLHEVSTGGCTTAEYSAEALGLSVAEGKMTQAGLQPTWFRRRQTPPAYLRRSLRSSSASRSQWCLPFCGRF